MKPASVFQEFLPPKEPHKLSTETEFVMYFEPHILCPTLNFITETREKNKMNFQDASLAPR